MALSTNIALSKKSSLCEALSAILQARLSELEQYYPGVLSGRDIEDLHRFRVALRKTRALLKSFRKFIPEAEHFTDEFKALALATSPVRDLDILMQQALVSTANNSSITPKDNNTPKDPLDAINPILMSLQAEQHLARKQMNKTLDSARCRKLFASWGRLVGELPLRTDLPIAAHIPASTFVTALIFKLCKKLLQEGLEIGAHPTAQSLHALRIRGKRLRYILESFTPVFKKVSGKNSDKKNNNSKHALLCYKEVVLLSNNLAALQTVLGDHHDAVTATNYWRQLATTLSQQPDISAEIITELESWAAAASYKQQAALPQFHKKLLDFALAC